MNRVLFTSTSEEWPTPRSFFAKLNRRYRFTLDPCATSENATCSTFFTKEDNGLAQDWGTHRVFCNPPYGRAIGAWVRKCFEASQRGALVVLLVPARTDTRWFHDFVQGKAEIRFIEGRLTFGTATCAAPFPSMIAVYGEHGRLLMCESCGGFFDAKRSDARTCSTACRKALSRHICRSKCDAMGAIRPQA
jgi:phage N-6-adenine-methyltransferase